MEIDPRFVQPLNKTDAAKKIGVSVAQLARMMADPDLVPPLPEPFHISEKRVAFLEHELAAWLLERADRTRNPPKPA